MTTVPPRPRRAVIEQFPLRNPETSNAVVMSRRAWWLVVAGFVFPGAAQAAAGSRKLAKLGIAASLVFWGVLAVLGILALTWRQGLVSVFLNPVVLLIAQILCFAYAVIWLVLQLDTLRLTKLVTLPDLSRIGVPILTAVLVIVSSGGALFAASRVQGVQTVVSIFSSKNAAVEASDGYYNILLLGADSGPGRDSARPDSISVVSINAETGKAVITGIPRDMRRVPFPKDSPLHELFPEGYTGPNCQTSCKTNELYTEVTVLRDGKKLYPHAEDKDSLPGVEAMKDAAEGLLGIKIPYYVFIDMKGFADLVDALGGVDITVLQRLPKGALHQNADGSLSGVKGWIEKGPQHMDGDTAQWYARSRYTTDDWDRMRRQRELQQAILAQFTPANVLARFTELTAAGSDMVKTDIPRSMLDDFAELALKTKSQKVENIELTPREHNIDQDHPDVAEIQALVNEALHPKPKESSSPKP